MKIGKYQVCGSLRSWTVVFEGSAHIRTWGIGLSLQDKAGSFNPFLFVTVGRTDEPQGALYRIRTLRRCQNGFRRMNSVIGGRNPQPVKWF